jgi:hypothetical protein
MSATYEDSRIERPELGRAKLFALLMRAIFRTRSRDPAKRLCDDDSAARLDRAHERLVASSDGDLAALLKTEPSD